MSTLEKNYLKKKFKKLDEKKTTHPEQPQRGPKDLHHQDLDEQRRVRRVRQRRRRPHHAHAEPAREVGPPRRQARRKERVAARVRRDGPGAVRLLVDVLDLRLEDDGDDDAVDGDGLAEDDAEGGVIEKEFVCLFCFWSESEFSFFSCPRCYKRLFFLLFAFAFSASSKTEPT